MTHWLWSRSWIGSLLVVVSSFSPAETASPEKGPEDRPKFEAGQAVFQQRCARCHDRALGGAPATIVLHNLSARTIYQALDRGKMRSVVPDLADSERRHVAEFLSNKVLDASPLQPLKMCVGNPRWFAEKVEPLGTGWGIDDANTRRIAPEKAGLSVAEVKHLELKWAFAFRGAAHAIAQPLLAGGGLFVGSQDGTFYALDARTGCVHWTFHAIGEIQGGAVIGPARSGRRVIFLADRTARAYALDARTGKSIWQTRVDDHAAASVMGTPALVENRLFVPVLSMEETAAVSPGYVCCTFRGSLVALDALTGAVEWKRYTIPQPATERSQTESGKALFGPSGAGLWSTVAIDRRRGLLYFTTGNSYSEPADENSDAVFAVGIGSGEVRWRTQTLANDNFNINAMLCEDSATRQRVADCSKLTHQGPDSDFTTQPVLVRGEMGDVLIAGRKDGTVFGFDPDSGRILWTTRESRDPDPNRGALHFGLMADGSRIIVPSMSTTKWASAGGFIPSPEDGLYALDAFTGKRLWFSSVSRDCTHKASCIGIGFAPIGMPGVAFAGAMDGTLRAYDTMSGDVIWHFDTAIEFRTISGEVARGGAIARSGTMLGDGFLYVSSGYATNAGNVLLAFAPRAVDTQTR